MQLVVLGMHRSGTSATAGLLARFGAYFGPKDLALPSAEDNTRGFWERRDVVDANDALLAASGATWFTPHHYDPSRVAAAERDRFSAAAKTVVQDLQAHPVSLIKDPRLCIVFDAWRSLLPRPFIVLVIRHPLSSARSLERRSDGTIEAGLALWEFYMRAALRHVHGQSCAVIHYDDLVTNPEAVGRQLIATVNDAAGTPLLRVPEAGECSRLLEPQLRHHQDSEKDLRAVAWPELVDLYAQVRAGNPAEIPVGDACATCRWALRLHESERLRWDLQRERDDLAAALRVCSPAIASAEDALRQMARRTEMHAALAASRKVRGSGPTLPDVHRMLDRLEAARDTAHRLLTK